MPSRFTDREADARRKDERRRQRRLDRKRQTPLEVDNEKIEELQAEIQQLIVEFSTTVFALEHPEMPNFRDNTHSTLLHHAVSKNNITCAKFLLSMKANPNLQNCTGADPLAIAIARGHGDMFNFLVDDVKVPIGQADKTGRTALHIAAKFGSVIMMHEL